MSYKISEDCISCGACESECPNGAIKEGDSQFQIDPNKCTECVGSNPSSKCAEVCPVGAPQPDASKKETRDELLAKWKKLHPGETPKA